MTEDINNRLDAVEEVLAHVKECLEKERASYDNLLCIAAKKEEIMGDMIRTLLDLNAWYRFDQVNVAAFSDHPGLRALKIIKELEANGHVQR